MACEPSGRKTCNDEAGFTLIEALISIGVFAVILIGILQVYDSMQYTYVRSMASADVQQSVRAALDLITHDIRLAGYDPSDAISNQKTSAFPNPLPPGTTLAIIGGDTDGNGITECVAYRLFNRQLQRWKANWTSGDCAWPTTPGATGTVVANNITALNVTYSPDPSHVKQVNISVTAMSPVGNRSFTTETEVALRQ
jgi:type IV pilus assembly protein PilW